MGALDDLALLGLDTKEFPALFAAKLNSGNFMPIGL
jgi:hypothetical protein